ncbi:MAG: F0F1 ATP synthase subunit epsilon [Deltaproteobacteria bacterium]|nr:F0F1 ATP synthase subunit epsilon [Deltaproteobacteria bacterium]
MGSLFFEIVTPEKVLVSQEVDTVVAPGSEGEFGVLPGHTHFLSGIVPGELRYQSGKTKEAMIVTSGFAEVSNDKVSILVDAAEKAGDIDIKRAQEAMERARERLAKERKTEEIDFIRAEASLKRAVARIKVAEKAAI